MVAEAPRGEGGPVGGEGGVDIAGGGGGGRQLGPHVRGARILREQVEEPFPQLRGDLRLPRVGGGHGGERQRVPQRPVVLAGLQLRGHRPELGQRRVLFAPSPQRRRPPQCRVPSHVRGDLFIGRERGKAGFDRPPLRRIARLGQFRLVQPDLQIDHAGLLRRRGIQFQRPGRQRTSLVRLIVAEGGVRPEEEQSTRLLGGPRGEGGIRVVRQHAFKRRQCGGAVFGLRRVRQQHAPVIQHVRRPATVRGSFEGGFEVRGGGGSIAGPLRGSAGPQAGVLGAIDVRERRPRPQFRGGGGELVQMKQGEPAVEPAVRQQAASRLPSDQFVERGGCLAIGAAVVVQHAEIAEGVVGLGTGSVGGLPQYDGGVVQLALGPEHVAQRAAGVGQRSGVRVLPVRRGIDVLPHRPFGGGQIARGLPRRCQREQGRLRLRTAGVVLPQGLQRGDGGGGVPQFVLRQPDAEEGVRDERGVAGAGQRRPQSVPGGFHLPDVVQGEAPKQRRPLGGGVIRVFREEVRELPGGVRVALLTVQAGGEIEVVVRRPGDRRTVHHARPRQQQGEGRRDRSANGPDPMYGPAVRGLNDGAGGRTGHSGTVSAGRGRRTQPGPVKGSGPAAATPGRRRGIVRPPRRVRQDVAAPASRTGRLPPGGGGAASQTRSTHGRHERKHARRGGPGGRASGRRRGRVDGSKRSVAEPAVQYCLSGRPH